MTTRFDDILIDADTLAAALAEPGVIVLDVREGEVDGRSATERYRAGHVPGAIFVSLQDDLSAQGASLRFTLPDADEFAAQTARLGLTSESTVVVVAEGWQIWATRVWWLLRYFGVDDVAVLDGGIAAWIADGRPVETGEVTPVPSEGTRPRPRPELVAAIDEVAEISAGRRSGVLVNALPAALFTGDVPTHGTIRGRIPGSVNLPWNDTISLESNRVESSARIAALADEALPDRDADTVAYCGGGVSATGLIFSLARIGRDRVRLYDGSLEQWAITPGCSLTTGPVEGTTPASVR